MAAGEVARRQYGHVNGNNINMKIIETVLFLFITVASTAQINQLTIMTSSTGDSISINFKLYRVKYPSMAKENGLQGAVKIMFDIDSTCSIVNRNVTNGIGGGCEEEAMKTLNAAEIDLKKRNSNRCKNMTGLTHEVKFKLN